MSWSSDSGKLWENKLIPLAGWPSDTHWDEKRGFSLTNGDETTTWATVRVQGSIHVKFHVAGPGSSLIEMQVLVNDQEVWSFRRDDAFSPPEYDLTIDADIYAFSKHPGDNEIRFRGSANGAFGGSNSYVQLNALNVVSTGTGTKGGTTKVDDLLGPIWDAVKPFVPWVVIGGLGLFALQVFLPTIIGFTRSLSGAFNFGGGGGYGGYPAAAQAQQQGQGQPQVLVIR